jgi:ABC-type multidrug transport system ATPase subunit
MKVSIKELGFVKSVDLDLNKDLTILCGPNNSGKTYVAYAIYGLMKFRNQWPKSSKIENGINLILDGGQFDFDIIEFLTEHDSKYLNLVAKSYTKQISNVYASDEKSFEKTEIKIVIDDVDRLRKIIFSKEIESTIKIRKFGSIKFLKAHDSTVITCAIIESEPMDQGSKDVYYPMVRHILNDRILDIIMDFVCPKTFIAPAERSAINIFSKELSLKRNVLVDKLLELKAGNKDEDPFDLINRRAKRYPMPIRDSLEISEDLNNFKKTNGAFAYLADDIEKEILRGQILISKEGDVQYKPDKAKTLKLPIHLTASVVKSLSNLVIYFRHLATQGDFIIIDEPELNLHPDNQVIIARIISKIVNKGFKVLISTHSDYIIRELNNLMMLNNSPKLAKEYEYQDDVLLDYKRVGAILFHYETRKTANLEITNTGLEVETIDKVINELNDKSQELLFNQDNE